MSRIDKPLSCARALVLLEPYLDGDLVEARTRRVEMHLQSCVDCRAALGSARQIQTTLRDLPALQAPAAVRQKLADAMLQTESAASVPTSAAPHWQDRLAEAVSRSWDAMTGKGGGSAAWLRPAAAVAALVLLVFVWVGQRQPTTEMDIAQFSKQELLDADYQARWALAYLAHITASAGDAAFIQVGDVIGGAIGEHALGSVTSAVDRSMQSSSDKKKPGEEEKEVQTP